MQTSREDRIALAQQNDQMNRQARLQQSYNDDYYGHGLNCDGDYRASRRVRYFSGSEEDGDYFEE
jgi:hypothetical protein